MPFYTAPLGLPGHMMAMLSLLLLTLSLRRWPRSYAVLTWPGTLAHECLHYLAGLMTGARPVSMTIIPRRATNGNWVLGEVAFARLRWWNSVPVGLAPLMLLPVGGWIATQSLALPVLDWSGAGLKQLSVLCLISAWPSRQDWGHAWRGLLVMGLLCLIALYLMDAQALTSTINKLQQIMANH